MVFCLLHGRFECMNYDVQSFGARRIGGVFCPWHTFICTSRATQKSVLHT